MGEHEHEHKHKGNMEIHMATDEVKVALINAEAEAKRHANACAAAKEHHVIDATGVIVAAMSPDDQDVAALIAAVKSALEETR